jgi:hypothetical protein
MLRSLLRFWAYQHRKEEAAQACGIYVWLAVLDYIARNTVEI